jgi:hypothetical protein
MNINLKLWLKIHFLINGFFLTESTMIKTSQPAVLKQKIDMNISMAQRYPSVFYWKNLSKNFTENFFLLSLVNLIFALYLKIYDISFKFSTLKISNLVLIAFLLINLYSMAKFVILWQEYGFHWNILMGLIGLIGNCFLNLIQDSYKIFCIYYGVGFIIFLIIFFFIKNQWYDELQNKIYIEITKNTVIDE